ncbi:MAG: ADP-heptose:LPS heptosyltransferase [Paraglaciecola sp.]|jgi:ADP-heptose:LPS heptosyltransferase
MTSLKRLLALLKLTHLVNAPDTGAAHIAVTAGTAVIGLFDLIEASRWRYYRTMQYLLYSLDN